MPSDDPCALDDTCLQESLRQIVKDHNIKVIVETGTLRGKSTVVLADMVPLVFTVENDLLNVCQSAAYFSREHWAKKIITCVGSSPDVLDRLKGFLPDETLYFLDAHWQSYWPLKAEISAVKEGTGVIVIHDMLVPGHPELGYDAYQGEDGKVITLDYEYVKEPLMKWSPHHRIQYNDKCEGTDLPRGVGFIFPK